MKILFYVRNDFYRFSGGDKTQILATQKNLIELGHQVDISTKLVTKMKSYDVVHLFNMQIDPHSLLVYAIKAHRQGVKVVLSTIYWNPEEWLAHEPPEATEGAKPVSWLRPFSGVPLASLVSFALNSPYVIGWFLHYILPIKTSASLWIKRQLIKQVDAILPNGRAEGTLVARDFGEPKAIYPVLNGVDNVFTNTNPKSFMSSHKLKDFILSVGRIESRKNVLKLAKACAQLNYQLVLIGNNTVESQYVARIKRVCPAVLVIPEMTQQELGSAYAAARVHALVSWFETPGLSSMEAGLLGCKIVTTDRGTTKEHFGDKAWYCDPTSQSSINKALESAWKARGDRGLKEHLKSLSWKSIAQKTQEVYEEVV